MNLKAGSMQTNVTVKAGQSLGTYSTIAAKFNQMLAVSSLPKADQAKLKQAQAASANAQKNAATMSPTEKMAMAQQAQQLKTLMAQANANTSIPTAGNGEDGHSFNLKISKRRLSRKYC